MNEKTGTPAMRTQIDWLRNDAAQMDREQHHGWRNTCNLAADMPERIAAEPKRATHPDWKAWLSEQSDEDLQTLFAFRPDLKDRLTNVFSRHGAQPIVSGEVKAAALLAWNRDAGYSVPERVDAIIEAIAPLLRGVSAGSKPIYQVWQSTDSCGEFWSWDDVDFGEYNDAADDHRRILYAAQPGEG